MANIIKIVESKSKRTRCTCCGEMIPTCAKFSKVRQDKFCHFTDCHTKYLFLNYPDAVAENSVNDGEEHLRMAEAFAGAKAAGNTASFWTDRDAGLV